MAVEVFGADGPPAGRAQDNCEVKTEDAAGNVRWYKIDLTDDDTFDDGYLLEGVQLHPSRCPVVSDLAYDAAREHFREEGWEVHG